MMLNGKPQPHANVSELLDMAHERNLAGNVVASLAAAEAALALAQQQGNAASTAQALDSMRLNLAHAGRLEEALAAADRAVRAWQKANQPLPETRSRATRCLLLCELGRSTEAIDAAYTVLRSAEDSGTPEMQAWALCALGVGYRFARQYDEAITLLERAVRLASRSSDADLKVSALSSCGIAYSYRATALRAEGQLDAARRFSELALDRHRDVLAINRERRWVPAVMAALVNIGRDLTILGRCDEAVEALDEALSHAQSLGDRRAEAYGLFSMGEIKLARKEFGPARAMLEQALEVSLEAKTPSLSGQCCLRLSEACERLSDAQRALEHHKQYHAFYAQATSEAEQRKMREAERRHEGAKAQATVAALEQETGRLARMTREDALTGLANRRRFDEVFEARRVGGRREDELFSLVLLDVDHFKHVNDRWSHQAGDEVLRRLGPLLIDQCRDGDLAARYGGEEFALVLAHVDSDKAVAVCERLRAAVQRAPWAEIAPGLAVTVSVGVADSREADGHAAMLRLADARLYTAKAGGRNRVVGTALEVSGSRRPGPC
jgi:two-component system cell cycle response regulator